MTYQFSVNNTPATGSVAIYGLISTLIAAGWTKIKDSDGTTYSSGGVAVSSGAAGAAGLGNDRAWINMRAPGAVAGSTREIIFQRGNGSDLNWRIVYSSTGFALGSPSATQTTSAADEQVLMGGGTAASPSFGSMFNSNNLYKAHYCADNANNYSFYALFPNNGTGLVGAVFSMDAMLAGTFPSADIDPYVFYITTYSGSDKMLASNLTTDTGAFKGYLAKGLPGVGFVELSSHQFTNSGGTTVVPGALGSNAHTNEDEELPFNLWRRGALTSPTGWKGVSSLYRWMGTNRTFGNTLSSLSRIVVGPVSLPWNGATVPNI